MKHLFSFLLIVIFTNVFGQTDTVMSKTIVDPTAMVAGSFGGTIQSTIFKAAKKIDVKGPDTSASVTSYTIYFQGTGFETAPGMLENIKGNLFTKDVVRLLARWVPGTTITIDYIKFVSVAFPPGHKSYADADTDYKRVSVFVGYELFINKISFEFQFGAYVYRPFDEDMPIYERLGVKYYFTKQVFSSLSLKTHGSKAEAIEYGIGVRLWKKRYK